MMKQMTSAELRSAFLSYFQQRQHEVVASSPLPNHDNPTLLFTNAGMNQFANLFLGKEKRSYTRAATSQKCMRVSGKHNDLENVGPSERHHTFFEMLGNFSFGDYFKKEAIGYAWEFLTSVVGLDPARIWASIYQDDDEAFELWQSYLPPEKIRRFGRKENYWEMGDVGPNGPCSEIHYYRGDLNEVDVSLLNNDADSAESFLEIWNLVFMQYETDSSGNTYPLPKPSIDTGMGLERITRIVQNARNNYETDLFKPALTKVQALLGDDDEKQLQHYIGYRVIADHGRAATFLISDGVIPGNTGAAYVLRMVIRRAARFGRKIGFTAPFLAEIAQTYIDEMGEAYPELRRNASFIKRTITLEEERFARTLDNALTHLEEIVAELKADGKTQLAGDVAFDLHATYGLPIEITRDLAQEQQLTIDEAAFQIAKTRHATASGAGAFGQYEVGANLYANLLEQWIKDGTLPASGIDYDPYHGATGEGVIIGLIRDGKEVDSAESGQKVEIVTTATPFYVESGGEVSDTGVIESESGMIRIDEMAKRGAGFIVHSGEVISGTIRVGELAQLTVDDQRRADIRRNHTATHLLHKALRTTLGTHVTQQGSLVAPDRLRFDFSHSEAVSDEQLAEIEQAINEAIVANYTVSIESMPKEQAVGAGAMALFGEKYGDVVRTVQIDQRGRHSFELCGGLHVGQTGEIGSFRVMGESSVASGVRRLEAVTGRAAQQFVADQLDLLQQLARQLNVKTEELPQKVEALSAENKRLQKSLEQLKRAQAKQQFETLIAQIQVVNGVSVLVAEVDSADGELLREMSDWFRNRIPSGVIALASIQEEKPIFVASVSQDLIQRGIKAGEIVQMMGKLTGGGGGGRPNLAQAGGRDVAKLPEAIASVIPYIQGK